MGITDLVRLGQTVVNIHDAVRSNGTIEEKLIALKQAYSTGSMGSFLKRYIVEPTIFISKSAYREPDVHDIINRQLDIFAGFYVDVFKTIITNYGIDPEIGVTVMGTGGGEDLAATAAIIHGAGALTKLISKETFPEEIPSVLANFESAVKSFESDDFFGTIASFEANDEKDLQSAIGTALKLSAKTRTNPQISPNAPGQALPQPEKQEKKDPSVFVRRMGKDVSILEDSVTYDFYTRRVEMRFTTNPKKVYAAGSVRTTEENGTEIPSKIEFVIPITIKASIISFDPRDLGNALIPKKKNEGFFARLEELRSGRIGYKEFFLGSDLIQLRKQHRLKDVKNLISQLEKNIASANLKTIGTGMVGFEKYYNMFIITQEDERLVKNVTGWDIVNTNGKERFLTALNAFSCFLVDTDYDKVGLMLKDVGDVTIIDRGKLKKKSKKDDITELVQAIMIGQAPRF